MQKNIFTVLAFILATSLLSCSKSNLTQLAPDQLTTDNYWISKDKALSGLAAAYSQLESFTGWDNYVEARSVREFYREDYIVPGEDAYNYSWWMDHYNFAFTSGNYAIDLLWRDNYRGINLTNQVLEGIEKIPAGGIDAADKKQIIAEAKFLRAYYHFKLLTNFDKIVLRDKVPVSEADLAKGLSERKDAYDMIVADLSAAEPDLPLKSERPAAELGRITKGAAQAYIGKVNLYRASEEPANAAAYYTNTVNSLKNVINSSQYQVDPDFLSMFNGNTRNGVESVFELQQTADASNGAYYRSFLSDWVAASDLGGYGEIYGTQRLLTEMKKEGKVAAGGMYDPRSYGTVYFEDSYFNDATNPRVYGDTYKNVFGNGNNIVAFRKWIPPTPDRIGRSNAINVPLMRYADVLLLYAEALNESGKPADAVPVINGLRKERGNMPALNISSKQDVFNALVHERVMEFTLEGSRFYDLRRWGLLAKNMQEAGRTFSADKAYYPLPLKETLNNPLTK